MKRTLSFLLVLIFAVSGCAGIKNSMRAIGKQSQWNLVSKVMPSKSGKTASQSAPATMSVLWTNSVFEKPGLTPVRGFGGRIFFYDEENKTVKADGELVVYAFDDSRKSENSQADRKFVFKQDSFQTHYSETDLGPSYSVWIPWEKVGGTRKTIALIPVFKTKDGRILKSGQSLAILPGKSPNAQLASASDVKNPHTPFSGVRQATYMPDENRDKQHGETDSRSGSGTPSTPPHRATLRTSTIRLTPHLSTQLSQTPPPQEASRPTHPPRSYRHSGNAAHRTNHPDSASEKRAQRPVHSGQTSTANPTGKTNPPRKVFGLPGAF